MKEEYLDQARPIREGEELAVAELEQHLAAHIDDFKGPLTVTQFPSGHSNLTYLLSTPDKEYVLRRPPFGNQVKTAHDMGREYHVLHHLSQSYPLAPAPLHHCAEENIIGDSFYIMPRCRGIILRRDLPDDLMVDEAAAKKLSENFLHTLVELHSLDYRELGLGDWGKPDGYVERQVSGWSRRYQKAQTDEIPQMESVASWLAENIPASADPSLIHNDFKYDNLVLDPEDLTRITAVLDWEMSTIGDPLMDLGTALAYWINPQDPPGKQMLRTCVTHLPGTLIRRELTDLYGEKTGRDVSNMAFYYCFALFKTGVVAQQIYARFARGHTQDKRFAPFIEYVRQFARVASEVIDTGEI